MAAEVPAVTFHSAVVQVLLRWLSKQNAVEPRAEGVCRWLGLLPGLCTNEFVSLFLSSLVLVPWGLFVLCGLPRMVQGWCTVMITKCPHRRLFPKGTSVWTMISPYCWCDLFSQVSFIYTTQNYKLPIFLKGFPNLHRVPNPLFFNEKQRRYPSSRRDRKYWILNTSFFGLISGALFQ